MFGIGCAMSVLSAFLAPSIAKGEPERFAIPYTLASCCSLGSTMFLVGPAKQCKRMFDKGRWIATTVFLVSMMTTLIICFAMKEPVSEDSSIFFSSFVCVCMCFFLSFYLFFFVCFFHLFLFACSCLFLFVSFFMVPTVFTCLVHGG